MRMRAKLINELAVVGNVNRLALQSELSIINSQIKALNIQDAIRVKQLADTRRARSAVVAAPAQVKAAQKAPVAIRLGVTKPRGEMILVDATRLRNRIVKIKMDSRAIFTDTFLDQLEEFIKLQKELLARESVPENAPLEMLGVPETGYTLSDDPPQEVTNLPTGGSGKLTIEEHAWSKTWQE